MPSFTELLRLIDFFQLPLGYYVNFDDGQVTQNAEGKFEVRSAKDPLNRKREAKKLYNNIKSRFLRKFNSIKRKSLLKVDGSQLIRSNLPSVLHMDTKKEGGRYEDKDCSDTCESVAFSSTSDEDDIDPESDMDEINKKVKTGFMPGSIFGGALTLISILLLTG